MRCTTCGLCLLLFVAAGVVPAQGQGSFDLEDVAVLSGCWAGQTGDIELRESWTEPDGGVMLGTTRFLQEGRVVDWEFGRIVEEDGGVTLWPYPQGNISEDGFPLVRLGEEIVFENLEHDFPIRIVYALDEPDRLRPRVEARDGRAIRWSVHRVPCPGSG